MYPGMYILSSFQDIKKSEGLAIGLKFIKRIFVETQDFSLSMNMFLSYAASFVQHQLSKCSMPTISILKFQKMSFYDVPFIFLKSEHTFFSFPCDTVLFFDRMNHSTSLSASGQGNSSLTALSLFCYSFLLQIVLWYTTTP